MGGRRGTRRIGEARATRGRLDARGRLAEGLGTPARGRMARVRGRAARLRAGVLSLPIGRLLESRHHGPFHSCGRRLACAPETSAPATILQLAASLDRPAERYLVSVLEVPAHGKPAREPRHVDAKRLDRAREVGRGRLALDVWIRGEDDLRDRAVCQAREQPRERGAARALSCPWRDDAAEHVIQAVEGTRPLDRRDVSRLGDDADGSPGRGSGPRRRCSARAWRS